MLQNFSVNKSNPNLSLGFLEAFLQNSSNALFIDRVNLHNVSSQWNMNFRCSLAPSSFWLPVFFWGADDFVLMLNKYLSNDEVINTRHNKYAFFGALRCCVSERLRHYWGTFQLCNTYNHAVFLLNPPTSSCSDHQAFVATQWRG